MEGDGKITVDLRKGLPKIDADVSDSVRKKAQRIVAAQNGVRLLGQENTFQYEVTSPSGQVYRVVVAATQDWITCDCPYGKRKPGRVGCSHALAVWKRLTMGEGGEFA